VLLRRLKQRQAEEERTSAEAVICQLDRMNELVTSILEAARLAESNVRLELAPGDLVSFMEETVRDWSTRQPDVAFTFSRETQPTLEVPFDRLRLRQLLNTLLSNAVKFGGRAGRVEVTLLRSSSEAIVQIRDWGPGIAAAELPKLFERFHRAEATGRGHGLELFTAAALAKLHGGSLQARSALGEGSTFSLQLPLSPQVRA
jgi:two-component system, sensor histidine kinase and response regulator